VVGGSWRQQRQDGTAQNPASKQPLSTNSISQITARYLTIQKKNNSCY